MSRINFVLSMESRSEPEREISKSDMTLSYIRDNLSEASLGFEELSASLSIIEEADSFNNILNNPNYKLSQEAIDDIANIFATTMVKRMAGIDHLQMVDILKGQSLGFESSSAKDDDLIDHHRAAYTSFAQASKVLGAKMHRYTDIWIDKQKEIKETLTKLDAREENEFILNKDMSGWIYLSIGHQPITDIKVYIKELKKTKSYCESLSKAFIDIIEIASDRIKAIKDENGKEVFSSNPAKYVKVIDDLMRELKAKKKGEERPGVDLYLSEPMLGDIQVEFRKPALTTKDTEVKEVVSMARTTFNIIAKGVTDLRGYSEAEIKVTKNELKEILSIVNEIAEIQKRFAPTLKERLWFLARLVLTIAGGVYLNILVIPLVQLYNTVRIVKAQDRVNTAAAENESKIKGTTTDIARINSEAIIYSSIPIFYEGLTSIAWGAVDMINDSLKTNKTVEQ